MIKNILIIFLLSVTYMIFNKIGGGIGFRSNIAYDLKIKPKVNMVDSKFYRIRSLSVLYDRAVILPRVSVYSYRAIAMKAKSRSITHQ